jgi:hypothetical protein
MRRLVAALTSCLVLVCSAGALPCVAADVQSCSDEACERDDCATEGCNAPEGACAPCLDCACCPSLASPLAAPLHAVPPAGCALDLPDGPRARVAVPDPREISHVPRFALA